MPRNTLEDLNNHLFGQLEKLGDDSLTGEDLKTEIERGKTMAVLGKRVIESQALALAAVKHADEYGYSVSSMPLRISNRKEAK